MESVSTIYSGLQKESTESVFLKKPMILAIDEDSRTTYASNQKIETLIKELKEKGPLVGLGSLGPKVYLAKPFMLQEKKEDQEIYGWQPKSERVARAAKDYFIIVGAEKINERELVYFTMSCDNSSNASSFIRTHIPSPSDPNIYVVSHKTFRDYIFDLYPAATGLPKNVYVISSKCEDSSPLSPSEAEYFRKLCSITPLDSILIDDKQRSSCKALGQEIFDKYKKEAGNDSFAGKAAVQKICDAVRSHPADGKLRKQYIERAWDGIGDKNWFWMA